MAELSSWRLDGKTAVVTGASEGIGFAVAAELKALGARVIIASRSEDKLKHAIEKIGPEGVRVVAADLATPEGRQKLVDEVKTVGRLDVLVNNLGIADRDLFTEMEEERARAQLELNLVSTLALTKSLFPLLRDARGAVINVSSVAAQRALPERLWYGVAKAALDQATRALAYEWGPHGVRVNAVSPWFTQTALTQKVLGLPGVEEKILSLTPLRRLGAPADVARAVSFLAMPASAFVNGVVLPVDGGHLAQSGF